MKQRIFSHFQDYLIQYISHQYQDLLYCNSSQYILSTYNSQHNNNNNNNNNVVLAMTMPYTLSRNVYSVYFFSYGTLVRERFYHVNSFSKSNFYPFRILLRGMRNMVKGLMISFRLKSKK